MGVDAVYPVGSPLPEVVAGLLARADQGRAAQPGPPQPGPPQPGPRSADYPRAVSS
jgi:hypothetical protein